VFILLLIAVPARAEKRVALVIGNAAYKNAATLGDTCHASGRRSGDQFCVYVADRLVMKTSARSPQVTTEWTSTCADTSMRTSVIGSLCCPTQHRPAQLKLRSKAADGRMAARFLTPESSVERSAHLEGRALA
jgi:hypothetical protein